MLRSHDPILINLSQKRMGHIKPGLERVRQAYEHLGQPAKNIPCVLIGGTNGKGMTAGFSFNLLSQMGYRVGIYSSPHLLKFCERIQLSDTEVSDQDLLQSLEKMRAALPPALYEEMSFFEITTLLALYVFAEQKVEAMVVEVGLGGRWDATNILSPLVSAVVSVGLDHQDYLGSTLESIAQEKVQIFRRQKSSIVGFERASAAGRVAMSHAEDIESPLYFATESSKFPEPTTIQQLPSYVKSNYQLACLIVSHLATALNTSADFKRAQLEYQPLAPDKRRWPPCLWGRFHHMEVKGKSLLLDACHNIHGAQAFVEALRSVYGSQKLPGLVSILADKDVKEVLDILSQQLDPLVLFEVKNPRSLKILPKDYRDLRLMRDFRAAWDYACKHMPNTQKTPWVMCGSVYGLGEALNDLGIESMRL